MNILQKTTTLLVLLLCISTYSNAQVPIEWCDNCYTGGSERDWTVLNGKLLFNHYDSEFGRELWISDKTEEGTKMLKDLNPGKDGTSLDHFVTTENGVLYFQSNPYPGNHWELWKSDGTEEGTLLVKKFNQDTFQGLFDFTAFNDLIVFRVFNSFQEHQIYRSDGTSEGTYLIKKFPQFNDISTGRNEYGFAVTSNHTFFTVNDGIHGVELWKTDGSTAGTSLVKDISSGSTNSYPSGLAINADKLYFYASPVYNQYGFYSTDGTETNTIKHDDMSRSPELASRLYNGEVYYSNFTWNSTNEYSHSLRKLSSTGTVSIIKTTFGNKFLMQEITASENQLIVSVDSPGLESNGTIYTLEVSNNLVPFYTAKYNISRIKYFSFGPDLYFTHDDLQSSHNLFKTSPTSANLAFEGAEYRGTYKNLQYVDGKIHLEKSDKIYYLGAPKTNSIDNPQIFEITAYPNPTSGTFKITNLPKEGSLLRVTSSLGQVVLQKDATGPTQILTLAGIGVYNVEVVDKEGHRYDVKRIVVSK